MHNHIMTTGTQQHACNLQCLPHKVLLGALDSHSYIAAGRSP